MTINYYTKSVYGNDMLYLAGHRDRQAWADMTGRKTITENDMAALSALTGVTFNRVFEAEA